MDLYDAIMAAVADENKMVEVIEKFRPIMRKYAKLLGDEDAEPDFVLFFISLVRDRLSKFTPVEDKYILSYIKKSFRTEYIAKSKEKSKNATEYWEDMEGLVGESDIESSYEFMDFISQLTGQQKKVILLKYYYGCTDTEIAGKMGVSRQAVNQIKNRALKSLKGQLTKGE